VIARFVTGIAVVCQDSATIRLRPGQAPQAGAAERLGLRRVGHGAKTKQLICQSADSTGIATRQHQQRAALARTDLSTQTAFGKYHVRPARDGRTAIDDLHSGADESLDFGAQERIVGAAKDNDVHVRSDQRLQERTECSLDGRTISLAGLDQFDQSGRRQAAVSGVARTATCCVRVNCAAGFTAGSRPTMGTSKRARNSGRATAQAVLQARMSALTPRSTSSPAIARQRPRISCGGRVP
jgi:hypothetical protein